jgi:hypothetical protein
MTKAARTAGPMLCPSATTIDLKAQIFGVLTTTNGPDLRVGYLKKAVPATPELLAASAPAKPAEVFRAATPCSEGSCAHFDGTNCQLATRVAAMLQPVVGALPICAIRRECRWFRQAGGAACVRCPQVATERRNPNELQITVSGLS